MARMTSKGLDGLNKTLIGLAGAGYGIAKMAVYDGAKVITDEVRARVKRLEVTEPGRPKDTDKIYGFVTDLERNDLEAGLGIARITYDDGKSQVRTVIGFAGYGRRKTRRYRRSLPNAFLARSISKPSKLREQNKFTENAMKKARKKAVAAMVSTGEKAIAKIIAE